MQTPTNAPSNLSKADLIAAIQLGYANLDSVTDAFRPELETRINALESELATRNYIAFKARQDALKLNRELRTARASR